MLRIILSFVIGILATVAVAQEARPPAKATGLQVGKDEKLCRVKFADGQIKTWVCKKDAGCCSWDEAKYVRCGTMGGCLIGTAPIRER